MLIIPVENRPDWRNPPLATLLLIVINVLVFFVYQGKDPQRLEQSFQWYAESGLLERERGPFLDYLQRTNRELLDNFDTVTDNDTRDPEQTAFEHDAQFQHAVHDREFGRALHRQLDGDVQWRADRGHFEALIGTISNRAYAFTTREARPVTWVTSMFLHGDVMHLLGNMVFLFVFGFALEIAIGRGTFLLLYLCSGLGGTLLFWASKFGTDDSVLGASGAISGLMGMYIALYGLRRINFAYYAIFFIGQVRAPALIMFPLWVGYELWGARYATGNVAHWAHTGGLLFGFVLLALWMRFGLKVDRDYVDKIDHDAPFRAALARIQELMVAMKPEAAHGAAQALVQAHPGDARAWRSWYNVVRMSPSSREYHQVVHGLFKHACNAGRDPGMQTLLEEVAHEYVRIGGATPALTESVSLLLARRLGRVEHIDALAVVVERLLALACRHEAMPRILQAAGNLAARAGKAALAQHFHQALLVRFPDSQEARQLTAHAPA